MRSFLIASIAVIAISGHGSLSSPVEQEKQGSQVLECYDNPDFGGDIVRWVWCAGLVKTHKYNFTPVSTEAPRLPLGY